MKIVITADGDKLDDKVDQRFGRCLYFLIINIEGNKVGTFEAVENEGSQQVHGAGIRAAEQIGELDVDAIITGQLGPNATAVLNKFGIKAYHGSGIMTDVLNKFVDNKLEIITDISEPHDDNKDTEEIVSNNHERIFIPLLDDNGLDSRISEHFGHAPFFGLYDVEEDSFEITPNDLDHTDPDLSPIDQIIKAVNPTTIFAKSIGGRAINIIKEKGLKLKTADFETIKDVLENRESMETLDKSCEQ